MFVEIAVRWRILQGHNSNLSEPCTLIDSLKYILSIDLPAHLFGDAHETMREDAQLNGIQFGRDLGP